MPEAQSEMGFGVWLCEIQAQSGAAFRGQHCIQPPNTAEPASPSLGCCLIHEQHFFFNQPTNQPTMFSTCITPANILAARWSGLWEPQCHLSAKQVFPCPFTEVTPYCCWRTRIYNDRSSALTSSPPQMVYYWNANSTIAVMTLFYKAHISGTCANGLKKWSS